MGLMALSVFIGGGFRVWMFDTRLSVMDWWRPALWTVVAVAIPPPPTGTGLFVRLPFPSWPAQSSPQPFFAARARKCASTSGVRSTPGLTALNTPSRRSTDAKSRMKLDCVSENARCEAGRKKRAIA